jgi:transcriptional regulator with XRE-family HTH domain
MTIYEKIGHRIKMLREKAGISQDVLSQKMGISRPAVSQIESGERKLSADELQKLSRIFQVAMDNLLNPVKETEVHLHKGGESGQTANAYKCAPKEPSEVQRSSAVHPE